ncbi:MAG: Nif-specific regulatory protein [Pseudomonadota bacterium]|jgi:two-component system response regulator FlrC
MMSEQSAMVVWLDPLGMPGSVELNRLAESGWHVMPIQGLQELGSLAGSAARVVVRVIDQLDLLIEVRRRLDGMNPRPELFARIDRDCFDLAVAAMRQGADHVIASDDFSLTAWRGGSLARVPAEVHTPRSFVFVDQASRNLLALAERVARAEIGVLVTGPTGAGKEVLARVIHESSPRARGPFVALNCAALPETLIESMLFGHEKGAFTGAASARTGLFEQAAGGTLFLDEIGEMPYALQSRLLRVLQERELVRLGGHQTIKLDFRLVAATNRDLKAAIAAREFREDLYFRISAFRLNIPMLRERPGDILPLAAFFLARQSRGLKAPVLSTDAAAALLAYRWPGNVRELENVIQRALVLGQGDRVELEHLVFDEPDALPAVNGLGSVICPPVQVDPADALHTSVRATEYQAIMAAIRDSASRSEAAARLGISPRTLRYKLARLRDQAGEGGDALDVRSLEAIDEGVTS